MDKRKIANQMVKDKLLAALIDLIQQKDLSKVTITELVAASGVARASFYRNFKSMEELIRYGIQQFTLQYYEGSPWPVEDFRNRELMRYKFWFYGKHASFILAFHRAKVSISLVDVITDCVIDACGDMPTSSISKYELFYYAGAFYNMLMYWLEGGARESPEAMADEFLRLANGQKAELHAKS